VKSPLGSLLNQFLVRMDPHTQKPSGANLADARGGGGEIGECLYTSAQWTYFFYFQVIGNKLVALLAAAGSNLSPYL
jgi:hypothetical protein